MRSDEELFEQLVQGDMRAFDELYARLERPLFGFILAQMSDRHEAEDVLHDAFLAVLRERDARHGVRSFRAWLFQVARNLCLNRVRSRKRAWRALEAVGREEMTLQPPAQAPEEMERRERASALSRGVEQLPQSLAEVYQLRAAGMSYDEVAAVLHVPLGTVKSRMNEMVKLLREEMQR